jgi:hypothetical protein
MIPLRLVLDTNVVVSAALKPDGLQRTVLLLVLTKPARDLCDVPPIRLSGNAKLVEILPL